MTEEILLQQPAPRDLQQLDSWVTKRQGSEQQAHGCHSPQRPTAMEKGPKDGQVTAPAN